MAGEATQPRTDPSLDNLVTSNTFFLLVFKPGHMVTVTMGGSQGCDPGQLFCNKKLSPVDSKSDSEMISETNTFSDMMSECNSRDCLDRTKIDLPVAPSDYLWI